MAQYEIDELAYAELQRVPELKAVYGVVDQIMKNPKARKQFLAARKEADPSASIPEIDATAPIQEAVKTVSEEVANFRKEVAEERAERESQTKLAALNSKWERGQAKLRDAGWEPDGIKAIEELMESNGIADHEIAAAYYEKLHPPAEPVAPTSTRFDIFSAPSKDEVMKLLHDRDDNGEAFLSTSIPKILSDIRSGNGRR